MNSNNPQHIVTDRSRLSYAHLFTPYASVQGSEPKYSVTVLIPKSDIGTKQRIDAAINAAIQAGVSTKWNGIRPPQVAIPVHDGDGIRPSDGMPFGEECRRCWVVTASSKQPPQVVDAQCNHIINESEVYSGIYARVSMNFFPYSNSGKKGIGCGLNNVMKLEDGEPLGGKTTAADDFGGGNPAFASQQPSYQQYQQSQNYLQPQYGQQAQIEHQQQPVYQQQSQIDPITGRIIAQNYIGEKHLPF